MRAILAGVLLILCSCQHPLSLTSLVQGTALSASERADFLRQIRERSNEIRSYRMLCSGHLRYGEQRSGLRYAFVFSAPGSLRIEALPPNAAYTLSVLAVNEGRVLFLDQQNKSALKAASGSGALYRALRIPANEQDLPWIIAGRVPPTALTNDAQYAVYRNPSGERLYLLDPLGRVLYIVSAASLMLESVQMQDQFNGREALKIELQFDHEGASPQLPHDIELTFPRDDFVLSLSRTSQVLNLPIPERLFELQIPGDFELHELSSARHE
ncbi:MAG: hypothetical protein K1X83_07335 [Oligoflexia bacterium]|nr:hypothetical protein [Oligoflexia bacterium]